MYFGRSQIHLPTLNQLLSGRYFDTSPETFSLWYPKLTARVQSHYRLYLSRSVWYETLSLVVTLFPQISPSFPYTHIYIHRCISKA